MKGDQNMSEIPSNLGDDLLVGADAIAWELGFSRRRVYHLADQGDLPIHRVKGLGICARKSALREYFEALDCDNAVQGELPFGQG